MKKYDTVKWAERNLLIDKNMHSPGLSGKFSKTPYIYKLFRNDKMDMPIILFVLFRHMNNSNDTHIYVDE